MDDAPDLSGYEVHMFHDAPLPSPYAATIQFLRTGAAMAAMGARVTLQSGPREAGDEAILDHYGLEAGTVALSPFFGGGRLRGAVRRQRLRARMGADGRRVVLWTRGEQVWPQVAPLLQGRPRPRLVHEVHRLGFLREAERRSGRRLDRDGAGNAEAWARESEILGRADGHVFLTEAVAEDARETFGLSAPSIVAPSGVTVPALAEARPDVDVVYAGKIEARKGVFDLCEAMTHLPGRSLALAGGRGAALEALRERVADLGLVGRVEVAGWIAPSDIAAFLRRGRIGACPLRAGEDAVSDRYSSPMKLLEMMALGLPVVATDLPPVRRIAGGDAVALARPNDPADLARAVERLLGDPTASRAMARVGRERAKGFAWPARAARIGRFLRALDGAGP
jgi:glycosyltransferase involved in cell wall biosynthesis